MPATDCLIGRAVPEGSGIALERRPFDLESVIEPAGGGPAVRFSPLPGSRWLGAAIAAAWLVAAHVLRRRGRLPRYTDAITAAIWSLATGGVLAHVTGSFAWLLCSPDLIRPDRRRPRGAAGP